jgi:hypothetical protein
MPFGFTRVSVGSTQAPYSAQGQNDLVLAEGTAEMLESALPEVAGPHG